jgi:hypothetical protein
MDSLATENQNPVPEKVKKVKMLTPLEIKTYVASIQKSNPSDLGK